MINRVRGAADMHTLLQSHLASELIADRHRQARGARLVKLARSSRRDAPESTPASVRRLRRLAVARLGR